MCVNEFNTNQLQTERKEREKEDWIAKIKDLKMTIMQLTETTETLMAEIAGMQVQLKRTGVDRQMQNTEFQITDADQRATQRLLQAVLTVLRDSDDKKVAVHSC